MSLTTTARPTCALLLCAAVVSSLMVLTHAGTQVKIVGDGPGPYTPFGNGKIVVLDLRHVDPPTMFAAQVCVGLLNRDVNDDSVAGPTYTIMNGTAGADPSFGSGTTDETWLENLNITPPAPTPLSEVMSRCLGQGGVAKGYLRYSFKDQHVIIPNLVTLAAVLDAVPLEDGSPFLPFSDPVFDALKELGSSSPLQATEYVYEHHLNATTGMAMMNPGYEYQKTIKQWNPPLVHFPRFQLVDFIVKERLFNMYLNNACIPLTKEHKLMSRIAANNPWPKPVAVYGYYEAWVVFGGDLFEATSNCVKEHNMGTVATAGTNNLAFFSRAKAVTTPLVQNPEPYLTFNSSKTYLSLIVGDGDNVEYLKTSRMLWMRDRVARCKKDHSSRGCYPLTWSISGHPLKFAPDWMQWYYAQAHATGRDYFTMPPSGYLYAYPSQMPPAIQEAFVKKLEEQCTLMSTSTTVSWEGFASWGRAMRDFYPRYGPGGVVRGVFAVNVPFNLPVPAFGRHFYKVLTSMGGEVVMFRPREWRGQAKPGDKLPPFSKGNYKSAEDMAREFSKYPRGTVTNIYLTSDGGGNMDQLDSFVAQLEEHVEVVGPNQLVDLALQHSRK